MKKLGLALGSGGARGVAHVGFLEALEEAGIRADYVSGCSMGSIVGACYCAGVPLDVVKERILSLKLSHVAALNVNPIRSNGLFKFTKARKLIEEYIPPETTFADLKIPFTCVATDLVSGVTVELKEGNVIDAILASSCIPGAFSPQIVGNQMLVDGGVLERVPTREVKKLGAEVIVAVDVLGNRRWGNKTSNAVRVLMEVVDILDTRIARYRRQENADVIDVWLEPELGDMSEYSFRHFEEAYESGYRLGREHAEEIAALRR